MTDSSIRDFVVEQRELLELELQAEQEEVDGQQQDSKSEKNNRKEENEERASHVLTKLEASDVSVGLYGRTVVQLTNWAEAIASSKGDKAALLLPAHRFTVGDEVEIRSKGYSGGSKNRYPGGVISAVSDTSVSVALFQQQANFGKPSSGSNKNDQQSQQSDSDEFGEGIGMPPLSLISKSSVEVHRKLGLALDQLYQHGVDHPIAGRVIDAMFNAKDFPCASTKGMSSTKIDPFNCSLDQSQLEAISFALLDDRPVSLIHGPPGTGKTTTTAELIYQAVRIHGMKVLVTAPSNVAVDNLLERLVLSNSESQKQQQQQKKTKSRDNKRGGSKGDPLNNTRPLRAVRLGHPARIKSSIISYSLEALVQNADATAIVSDVRDELKYFLKILSNPKSRAKDKRLAYKEVKSLRKEVRTREEKVVEELITNAQVVLATTVGAANRKLSKVDHGFDLVIIDEAAQALEASCWIPILRGKKVVLVGDHCQLPPTIKSRHHRVQTGLGKTMFERLMELYGDDHHDQQKQQQQPPPQQQRKPRISRMLKIQYRMHQDIANWASQAMYGGALLTHESVKDRTLSQLDVVKRAISQAPNGKNDDHDDDDDIARMALLLVDTTGCDMHETVNAAGSRFNTGESQIVALHVRRLLNIGLQQSQIAIITPYNGQVELLRGMLLPEFPKLEIRSVDGFQGGEREAVVLSLVRSSDRFEKGGGGIGFLRDNRRQNVAVTRAMRHLAVVCDSEVVSQSKFIQTLIAWMEEHGQHRSAIEFLSRSNHDAQGERNRNNEEKLLKMVQDGLERSKEKEKMSNNGKNSGKPKDDSSHDVARRKAMMEKITAFAEKGKNGDEMALSSELTSYDRRLVHELAEQIGLAHKSEGVEGSDRRIILTVQKSPSLPAAIEQPETSPPRKVEEKIDETEDGLAPVSKASPFAALRIDDDDSDTDEEESTPNVSSSVCTSEKTDATSPTTNQLLGSLAKERAEREKLKREAESKKEAATTTTSKAKKKKNKGRKLGGVKKKPPPKVDEDLDDLDDMAFLDAQVNKAQNAHGRQVKGSGNNYRTVMNGILNSKPPARETPKNVQASASLQAKLKKAQNDRKGRKGKKKK